tara:strand:+ start:351 stop:536 length:186 start_codon:yes stop_codon:yes gene_type:complete
MNPIWALLFKDRIRTPFSVYKMSLAEFVVLCGIIFGIGYGISMGAVALKNSFTSETAVEAK